MKDSAIAGPLPLANGSVNLKFMIADHPPLPAGTPSTADYVSVSPGYFHVMGIPLLRGRQFVTEDSKSSSLVTVISESFAHSYFPDENPLGKKLVFGFPPGPPVAREIVGVVGNVRDAGLTKDPGPMMYVPFAQSPFWGGELVVKSNLPPSAVVGSIREVVRSIDRNLPITDIATMPDVVENSVAQPKYRTWLLGAFGIVALLLAAAGVFGVVSYSVASRTRELGLRAALGASPATIGKMILTEGLTLAVVGLAVGLAAALGLTRFLRSELYGVASNDPATFLVSAAILLAVALMACFLPARRAMFVDPMITLRCE
jgi:putative ABC transport system permease protein